jgi:hypothetical protein
MAGNSLKFKSGDGLETPFSVLRSPFSINFAESSCAAAPAIITQSRRVGPSLLLLLLLLRLTHIPQLRKLHAHSHALECVGRADKIATDRHDPARVVAGTDDDVAMIANATCCRIESPPAEPREVDLDPRMGGAFRRTRRRTIQVATDETRGDAQVTQCLHH